VREVIVSSYGAENTFQSAAAPSARRVLRPLASGRASSWGAGALVWSVTTLAVFALSLAAQR